MRISVSTLRFREDLDKFVVIIKFSSFQVQLLYNDENLNADVQFLIKRLEILQTDPVNLKRSYNIDHYLESFCKVRISLRMGCYFKLAKIR